MSSDHDIREDLIRYAERGHERTHTDVLLAARCRANQLRLRRRLISGATAAGLVGALVAGTSHWRSQANGHTIIIADSSTSAPSSIDSIELTERVEVPGRDPEVLGVAFGLVWVTTVDRDQPAIEEGVPNASTVWALDQSDGHQVASYHLDARATSMHQTADAVIIRVSTGGPAIFSGLPRGAKGTNAIYRIDPSTDEVKLLRPVIDDGATATTEDLIAVGYSNQVDVLDSSGAFVSSVTTAAMAGRGEGLFVVGDSPLSLQFANERLFAVLGETALVARIDPRTGAVEMRTPLVTTHDRVVAAASWSGGFWVQTTSSSGGGWFTPWTIDSKGTVANSVPADAADAGLHLIDVTATGEAVSARYSGEVDTVGPGMPASPARSNSANSRLVVIGEHTWVAWSSDVGDTASVIEFRRF